MKYIYRTLYYLCTISTIFAVLLTQKAFADEIIFAPEDGSVVTIWNPIISSGWASSAICEYSYDNISFNSSDCQAYGDDIPAPATVGTSTLYLRTDTDVIGASSTFSYIPDPMWSRVFDVTQGYWFFANISSDGQKIVVTEDSGGFGMYSQKSSDGGITWLDNNDLGTVSSPIAMAASANHSIIIQPQRQVGFIPGSVFPSGVEQSLDGGVTWTPIVSVPNKWWTDVAVSDDGQNIFLTAEGDTVTLALEGDYITYSLDGGVSWASSTAAGLREWSRISLSGDGSLIIASEFNGYIYRSSDGGVSWASSTSPGMGTWNDISISSDGQYVLLVEGESSYGLRDGRVYLSSDAGLTWNTIDDIGTGGQGNWASGDISTDGSVIVVAGERVYLSTDAGDSWSVQMDETSTGYAQLSSDGSKIVVVRPYDIFLGVVDNTEPTISNVDVSALTDTAIIQWTTNEEASSYVRFGLTQSYTVTTTEIDTSPRVTSHEVTVTSLAPCTTYHYQVISRDARGNSASSVDDTFTTLGCVGGVMARAATTTEAVDSASGGNLDYNASLGRTLGIVIPVSFTSATSTRFVISELESEDVIEDIGSPLAVVVIGESFDIKAFDSATTTISIFDQPLTISLSYDHSEIVGIIERSLRIYAYDGAEWSMLDNCLVDTIGDTVTCETSHFSVFALFGTAEESSSGSRRHSSSSRRDVASVVGQMSVIAQVNRFDFNMSLGISHADVQRLQKYLNEQGFIVAATGYGSVGNETEYFGVRTLQALMKFQAAHQLPSTGYFGPMTRGVINVGK